MRVSKVLIIIFSLFFSTEAFALSEDAISVINRFKQKYDLNHGSISQESIVKTSTVPFKKIKPEPEHIGSTLSIKNSIKKDHIEKEKSEYIPGAAFSKAINRYRTARKTGQIPTSNIKIETKEIKKNAKKLHRYNINLIQTPNDRNYQKIVTKDKTAQISCNTKINEKSSIKQQDSESSSKLLKKSDDLLKKTKKQIPSTSYGSPESTSVVPNELPAIHNGIRVGSKKEDDEDENNNLNSSETKFEAPFKDKVIATQKDDEEFNQFIRRYDFKMPDNYRIIVR